MVGASVGMACRCPCARLYPRDGRRVDYGRPVRDMKYLAAISGEFSYHNIAEGLTQLRTRRHDLPPLADADHAKPLPVSATATINGRAWIDFEWKHVIVLARGRAPQLWYALLGACAVVIGYLGAGPRPMELRMLRRGCLSVRHFEGGAVRYYIDGQILKTQRDADDQQALAGIPHHWPVLPQAARAVEVLERLPHPPGSDILLRDVVGRPFDSAGVNRAINIFIELANQVATEHRLPLIEVEADGVSASRLRRTIGPFIRNRPDGAFGLAVVYGHTNSIIGAGSEGMKQTGSTRFLPQETAEHIAATLNSLTSSLSTGGGVSGPAAHHVLDAAATIQGAILTSRDWKTIVANPDIQAYDNPDTAVGCRFDPTTRPPCQYDTAQDARTEPDLANCQPQCANRFYTDQHAHEHQRMADQLNAWAEIAPEPEMIRLRRRASEHRATAARHWNTRIGPGHVPLPSPGSAEHNAHGGDLS